MPEPVELPVGRRRDLGMPVPEADDRDAAAKSRYVEPSSAVSRAPSPSTKVTPKRA